MAEPGQPNIQQYQPVHGDSVTCVANGGGSKCLSGSQDKVITN